MYLEAAKATARAISIVPPVPTRANPIQSTRHPKLYIYIYISRSIERDYMKGLHDARR